MHSVLKMHERAMHMLHDSVLLHYDYHCDLWACILMCPTLHIFLTLNHCNLRASILVWPIYLCQEPERCFQDLSPISSFHISTETQSHPVSYWQHICPNCITPTQGTPDPKSYFKLISHPYLIHILPTSGWYLKARHTYARLSPRLSVWDGFHTFFALCFGKRGECGHTGLYLTAIQRSLSVWDGFHTFFLLCALENTENVKNLTYRSLPHCTSHVSECLRQFSHLFLSLLWRTWRTVLNAGFFPFALNANLKMAIVWCCVHTLGTQAVSHKRFHTYCASQ